MQRAMDRAITRSYGTAIVTSNDINYSSQTSQCDAVVGTSPAHKLVVGLTRGPEASLPGGGASKRTGTPCVADVCACACRERAATKKLKRQLQQEKRGAMRELRKDSAFISAEHDAEKAAARAEIRAAGRAGLAIMQALAASQGLDSVYLEFRNGVKELPEQRCIAGGWGLSGSVSSCDPCHQNGVSPPLRAASAPVWRLLSYQSCLGHMLDRRSGLSRDGACPSCSVCLWATDRLAPLFRQAQGTGAGVAGVASELEP